MTGVRVLTGAVLAFGVLVAGCGLTVPTGEELPDPVPTLEPVAPPNPVADDARAIVERVRERSNATRNWAAVAHTEVIGPNGKRDYNVSRMAFKRPGTTAACLMDAANKKKTGTKLVFDGEREVAIKTFFFGILPIRITLPVTDDRLLDAYKRSLRDTHANQFMAVILHPQAEVRRLGTFSMKGEALDLLEFRSPASWKDLSREVIGVSRRTGLPVYRDCFDKRNRRIFHMELHEMRTNVAFSSTEFSLD